MRCVFLCGFLLSSLFLSAPLSGQGGEEFDPSEVVLVQIDGVDRDGVVSLVQRGVDIAKVQGSTVQAYLRPGQREELAGLGFVVTELPDPIREDPELLADYHTYAELTADLQAVVTKNPGLCRLDSMGDSVQGRALWILKISDHVDLEEDEPEFRFVSSMHGNEPVGMELCLNLISLLTAGYGNDPQITRLVDELEIWIMPLMNPDGYVVQSRYNAQGVDLNRDFPDRVVDPVNSPAGRAVETQHMMRWGFAHSPVLSANFHTGTLVVNYPYDSDPDPWATYSASPDDSLFIAQSLTYSSLNPPMYASPWFPQGITNGVAWYLIYGGMQDWNYVWQGCNDVTIELSDTSWPPYSQIPSLWDDNRAAMLAYMELCLTGVRGLVTDQVNGQPVAATVRVVGIDHDLYADPDVGDYHRMLEPGTQALEFSATGYETVTRTGIVVTSGDTTRLDVTLASVAWSDVGAGLAGTGGQVPRLRGAGPLTAGSSNEIVLDHALPDSSTHLVFGLTRLDLPFLGGTLVPYPQLVRFGLPVDATGSHRIAFEWPADVSVGTLFYLQHWVADPAGPAGFAASNGLEGETQ